MTKLLLGHADRTAVHIDLDILLRTRLLIQANSGGGKSWLLRRLAEQAFGRVQVILIDPEGEFATLRERHDVVLVGKGGETPADVRSAALVAHKLLELRASAVCDLYEMKASDRHRWVKLFLEAMIDAPKSLWHPVLVIVDEAHTFAPEKGAGESEASEAMIGLATRGRKRGFGAVFATQRLGKLRKDAAAELTNVLIGQTFIDIDRKRAAEALGIPRADERKFFDEMKIMVPGYFWALGRAIVTERVLVRVGSVLTTHPEPGSAKHAAEPPPPRDELKRLLPKLADLPQLAEAKAKTEAELRHEVGDLKRQLAARPTVAMPEVRLERVEVPIFKDGEVTRLESAVSALADVGAQLATAAQEITGALRAAAARPAPVRPQVLAPSTPVPRPLPMRPAAAAEHVGTLSHKPQQILDALAWLESVGLAPANKTQLALLSEASPSSSAYTNNLGALRRQGLIDYPGPALAALTAAGRAQAQAPERPPTTEDLQREILNRLRGKRAAILRVLIDLYPESVSKDDLAERSGASPTSSAYTNNLGALRSLGLVEYPAPGRIAARAVLFLER